MTVTLWLHPLKRYSEIKDLKSGRGFVVPFGSIPSPLRDQFKPRHHNLEVDSSKSPLATKSLEGCRGSTPGPEYLWGREEGDIWE